MPTYLMENGLLQAAQVKPQQEVQKFHLMKKQNATRARLVSSRRRKLSAKLLCHTRSKWKA